MKKTLALLLALVMVFALAACSSPAPAETKAPETAAPETQKPAEDEVKTDFPTKTMTIVCPYAAGGGTDLALRILADCAKDTFGQTVNVDNKTGGSGTVGLTEALNAAADGYTLGTCSVDLITLPLLGLAPEEVTRDAFEPICVINGEPAAIIVSANSPYETIEDFIKAGVDNPGSIRLANAGMGNIWHLFAIGLELKSGASFTHVPYDGAASAIVGVLGGDADAIVCSAAECASNIDAGEMRVLAVANNKRLDSYPDVPTFQEKGIDLVVVALRGLCVNAKAPDDVKQALKDGFEKVINSDACRQKVEEANMTYMPLNAKETNDMLDSMSGNFEDIVAQYLASAE